MKSAFRTASDEKMDESLGPRLLASGVSFNYEEFYCTYMYAVATAIVHVPEEGAVLRQLISSCGGCRVAWVCLGGGTWSWGAEGGLWRSSATAEE